MGVEPHGPGFRHLRPYSSLYPASVEVEPRESARHLGWDPTVFRDVASLPRDSINSRRPFFGLAAQQRMIRE